MFKRILCFAALMLLLSACFPIISSDFGINLSQSEKWEMYIQVVVPSGYEMDFQQSMNEPANELRTRGVEDVEVEILDKTSEGNVPIKMTLRGQGYSNLNDDVFGGLTVISVDSSSGKRLLAFELDPGDAGDVETMYAYAPKVSFTLHGGKIISHNGTLQDKNTVVWINPYDTMVATMEEPTTSIAFSDLMPYIAIGGGLILALVGLGILLRVITSARGRDGKYTAKMGHIHSMQTNVKYCPRCGSSVPIQAIYCVNCGNPLNT